MIHAFAEPWYILQVRAPQSMRYPTLGDWQERGALAPGKITAVKLPNDDHSFLLLLHELIEAWLCERAGIRGEAVDAFDLQYERERGEGLHGPEDEPGDDARAPYYMCHQIASGIERAMAAHMGMDWQVYEAALADASAHLPACVDTVRENP